MAGCSCSTPPGRTRICTGAWAPTRVERDFDRASIHDRGLVLRGAEREVPGWHLSAVEQVAEHLEASGFHLDRLRVAVKVDDRGGNPALGVVDVSRYGIETSGVVRVDNAGEVYVRPPFDNQVETWDLVDLDGVGHANKAGHPDLARRIEEHGRELAEEYRPRLTGGRALAPTEPGTADRAAPDSTAGEEVGGLVGFILSDGSAHPLSPDGLAGGAGAGANDGSVLLSGDGVSAADAPAASEVDEGDAAEGPEGRSLDW